MHALNIVKADCRRILRDKPIRIILIITVCFLALYYLFWFFIKLFAVEIFADMAEQAAAELAVNMVVSRIAFSGFMGLGTVGTLACLATAIFMGGDFTFNTIRNKLISGNSRVKTYVSSCVTSVIITCAFYVFICMLAMLANFILFGFNGGFLFKMAIVYLPLYVWIAVFVNFICLLTRSRSLTIVLTIIILSILPGLLEMIAAFMEPGNVVEAFNRFFPLTIFSEIVPINIFAEVVGEVDMGISTDVIWRAVFVPIAWLAGMIPFGAWAFTKADIK